MKAFLIILLGSLITISSFAQFKSGKITGSVLDGNTKTIESATITLLIARDSSVIKMSVADKTGKYQFEDVGIGRYLVAISAVGHNKGYSEIFDISSENPNITLKTIELVPQPKSISGVTVTGRKPLIEQKIDRVIVNVDAAVSNVGTNALELLEKSPGVSVDKDGNISLKGKQGVQVYIDGRPSYLSGPDLANLLSNMNSSQLDQIEIMTNPPARFEAGGNSGVINFKTKKNKQFGYSGSSSSTYSQGRLPRVTNGFNFNYRKNKVNLFTNVGQSYRRNFQNLDIQRKFIESSTKEVKSLFEQESRIKEGGESYNGKIGVDYFASAKTTFGAVVNGFYNPGQFGNTSNVRIYDPLHLIQSRTLATTENDRRWKHLGANVNFRHVFDSTGRELTADADYLTYKSSNNQNMINSYFTAGGVPNGTSDTLLGNLPQDINIYTLKLDYLQPLKKGARFEAGLKVGQVETDNNAIYNNKLGGLPVLDSGRSNHFIYKENVNAAYVNASTPLGKKWNAQVGLRLENTNADGDSRGYVYYTRENKFVPFAEKFKRNYTQLFPTAYLQFKASDKNSFVLNYGRRIERPDYEDLNPFILFLDKYTFEKGNPNLKPQFSHNFELTHSFKGFINTTLNYTKTTDIINEVLEQNTDRNETFVVKSNIASQQQVGLAVSAAGPLKKWWTANAYANVYHNRFEGIVNGDFVDLSATTGQFNVSNQFKYKTWTCELSGFYRTPGIDGVFRMQGLGSMNIGISKQVLKGKGTVRLSARDILYTQRGKGEIKYGNIDASFQQRRDSRQVSLGLTYRFVKGKMTNTPKRKTGSADDEKNRVNTGE